MSGNTGRSLKGANRRAAMRSRRHDRIRRKISGTPERPRLAVSRSLKHVTGQIIDDSRGVTIVGIRSSDPAIQVPPRSGSAAGEARRTQGDGKAAEESPATAEQTVGETAPQDGAGARGKKASKKGAKQAAEKPTKGGRSAKAKDGGKESRSGQGEGEGEGEGEGAKIALARATGRALAERARARGISRVVFDRGGYVYHGRIKAFAEGAREGGLEF